jgi:hypothetical protein
MPAGFLSIFMSIKLVIKLSLKKRFHFRQQPIQLMKMISVLLKYLTAMLLVAVPLISQAQSILGKWQLVKESSCLEGELPDTDSSLAAEMKQMSSPSPQIVHFKDKGAGEESMRIMNRKRTANSKNFLYKFTAESLYILDKRSQTISESYMIDKLTLDSLVISNATRACETKFFVKIRDPK